MMEPNIRLAQPRILDTDDLFDDERRENTKGDSRQRAKLITGCDYSL
jgi:hypothetical protein